MIQLLSKYKSYIFSFLLMVGMILSVNIFAATPEKTLGFQGQFYTYNTPGNAPVNATFTFYDSLSGGNITGTPISKIIQVVNGYFGTTFTEADTTGVDLNQQLYLEVSINGTTLSPRTTVNPTVSSLKSFGTFSYAVAPTVGPSGSLYFNTTTNELYASNGSTWQLAGVSSSTTQWFNNGTDLYFTTGNVGVGTSNPVGKFEVSSGSSSISAGDFVVDTNNKTVYVGRLSSLTGDNSNFYIRNRLGSNNFGVDGTTGGTFASRLSVGTTSASSAVFLVSSSIATPAIFERNSTSNVNIQFKNTVGSMYSGLIAGTSNFGIGAAPNLDLNSLFTIASNGYVGIGAITPFSRFTVVSPSVASSTVRLESPRVGIVAGDILSGIDFASNDSNLGANAITTASILALANTTHTTTALGTDLAFNTTNGTTTTEAMRIFGNGNVSIGTTTNQQKLTVANGSLFLDNMTGNGIIMRRQTDGASGTILSTDSTGATVLSSIGGGAIKLYPNNGTIPAVIISPTNTSIASGTLSIGSTGNAGIINLAASSSGVYTTVMQTEASNGFRMRLSGGGSYFAFQTNAVTDALRIMDNGNVGIGTTTPSAKLDIWGNLQVGTSSVPALSVNTALGIIGVNATNPTARLTIDAIGSTPADVVQGRAVGGGVVRWQLSMTASQPHFFVGSNLGIGTTTPGNRPLYIESASASDNGNSAIVISNTNTGFAGVDLYQGAASAGFIRFYNSTYPGTIGVANALRLGTDVAGGQVSIASGANVEAIRITSGGNVGIGTSTPLAKFHIQSSGASYIVSDGSTFTGIGSATTRYELVQHGGSSYGLTNGSTVDGGALRLGIGSGVSYITGGQQGGSVFNIFVGATSSPKFTVLNNGNVGIGTTTPQTQLQISSGAVSTSLSLTNTAGGRDWRLVSVGSGSVVGQPGSFGIQDNFASTTRLAIDTSGNVGIGTSTPGSKLEVVGVIQSTFDSNINTQLFSNFSGAGYSIVSSGIQQIRFATYGSNFINTGNLGIGTTTPGAILTVAGTIQSTALLGGATTLSTDANGNIIRTPSDQKLKTNVETLTSALDKVNQMRGVSYNWIDTNRFGTSSEIGFIAQELETIVPEVVKSGGEYKSVNYQNLTALLTEAIKELSAKVTGFSEKFTTKELCLEDVCINKDQLRTLLQQSANQHSNYVPPAPTPTPTPTVQDEQPTAEEPVTPPTDEPAPDPVVTPPAEEVAQ